MPSRGSSRARKSLSRLVEQIKGPMAERAVTEALIIGGGAAATMTPVDTSNLINSQFRIVKRVTGGVHGQMGYTAEYAAAVHDAPGTLRGQLRDPSDPGRGRYWDPSGEPEFLTKGFEMTKDDIDAAVRRTMKI